MREEIKITKKITDLEGRLDAALARDKKIDNSIRIRYTFSPREANTFGCDALILNAFFKSRERANRWWSFQAVNSRDIKGDVVQADAPLFQKRDPWPYSVRVIKRASDEYKSIATAVRLNQEVNIKTTELLDGQTGFAKKVG